MREESTVWNIQPTPTKMTWVNSNPFQKTRLAAGLTHVNVVVQCGLFLATPAYSPLLYFLCVCYIKDHTCDTCGNILERLVVVASACLAAFRFELWLKIFEYSKFVNIELFSTNRLQ